MSNIEHGRMAVIIYLCLLLVVVIINLVNEFEFLNVIYFITLVGCILKYLIVSKE